MSEADSAARAWDEAESTFAARAARRHIPLRGTFELTPRCSFNCKMCYVHQSQQAIEGSGKRELTTAEWLQIAGDAAKNGTLNLTITGGEPLIRGDFAEIYTELCKMGFIIDIFTNASLVDEKYCELFSKYPPSLFSVTLYGADRETYKQVTGNADNYDMTIRGLERLAALPSNLEIKATFIKDNKHQLAEIRETANRFTKRFAINYMVFKPVPGVCSEAAECRLSAKEAVDIDISNSLYYNVLDVDYNEAEHTAPDPNREQRKKRDYGLDVYPGVLTCLSAKAAYWISWDGRMLPCGTFDPLYTEPLKEGFKEAWDRLPSLFKGIEHPQKCIECEYFHACPNCPAYFYVETGAFDQVPEYICEMAREKNNRYAEYKDYHFKRRFSD